MSQTALDGLGMENDQAQVGGALNHRRMIAINRFYWPDTAATSQLLTDLMEFLGNNCHLDATVFTSRMLYGDPTEQLSPNETHGGVTIRRVWSSRFGRDRLVGRMIDYLSFYATAFALLLNAARRNDVILVTADPPLFAVLARFAAAVKGAQLVT